MAAYPTAHVVAKLTRGGFGNERTYHITRADGTDAIGLSPWWYCLTQSRQPMQDEPAPGVEIDGFVEARVLEERNGTAKVYLPDGEVYIVRRDQVQKGIPPATPGSHRHVPV